MYLIFDTETTGLPKDFKAPITDADNWPRCVQIAWQLHDDMGNLVEQKDFLDGDVQKQEVSKDQNKSLNTIDKSGSELQTVGSEKNDDGSYTNEGVSCIVVKKLTYELLNSDEI